MNARHLEVVDEWESCIMQFSLFPPVTDQNDELHIKGVNFSYLTDCSQLISSSAEPDSVKMQQVAKEYPWMPEQYWQKMRPF